MKTKLSVLLLTAVLAAALSACGNGAVQNVGNAESSEETEEYQDYVVEIPESVKNLSDEENILLNGELKDGVYINRYFGYRFFVPEGGTMVRDNDDATDSEEIIPLLQAYEDEWMGISITGEFDGLDGDINVFITALREDEEGMNEKELVEKYIQDMQEINQLFGEETGPEYGTTMLAGEEHPVGIYHYDSDKGDVLNASFFIPKGDFCYMITIHAVEDELDNLTKYFEKL